MNEKFIEKNVRVYLESKGWNIKGQIKQKGEHGCDIIAFHPKHRKRILIEAKGDAVKYQDQHRHNNFPAILGQVVSRMDIEGNSQNRARIYALAVPVTWNKIIENKVKKMKYAWRLLKLKVFLVEKDGKVIEKSYNKFL